MDVCDSLGIVWQGSKSLDGLRDDWKGVGKLPTVSGDQDTILIREAGVYKLAFRSHKTEAETFTDWIAVEVLPAIRRTGRYVSPSIGPTLRDIRLADRQHNRVRYAKISFALAVLRLTDLGVDVTKIDMATVVRFGQMLQQI